MSAGEMPELGSKISLISKADIRYEGKLYTVDPQDCTIALANVRSFGTENRPTAHHVTPQNQIYDYILFRATDIKDISVVPPTQLLSDPAILQLSAPSAMGNTSRFSGQGQSSTFAPDGLNDSYHPVIGSIGGNQYGGFNPMQSGLQSLTRPSPSEFLHQGNNDLLSGSRSSTPGLRKPSPTMDRSTQASVRKVNSPHKEDRSRNQQYGYSSGNRNDKPQVARNFRNEHHMQQNRNRNSYNQQQPNLYQNQQQQGGGGGGGGISRGGNSGLSVWGQQQQRGQQGSMQANRARGGHRSQQMQRTNFARAPGTVRKQPLKFESDYDFDKANNEFEELRSQLNNMKIDVVVPAPVPVVNGDDKKDDSGNETALAGEVECLPEDVFFYNKTKSFFDNISCEAVERSKGSIQRTDWRKERKLNTETFGFPSARRGMYRGGQRGGGYYYQGQGRVNYNYGGRGSYRPFRQPKPPSRPQQQPQVANA